ncbi:MAG: hypothetical protein ABI969_14215, partial [bacterium]
MRVALMSSLTDPTELFAGEGEVRAAFRRHDWSATPLGPEASWSPALRTSLLHVLWSAFPNLVLWGSDLVQLYNEAYLDLIGDQRLAGLGLPTRESSSLDWVINEPFYRRVMAGETISREGAPFSVVRAGVNENLTLTLSYAPIYDETSVVAGVLVTVFEAEDELFASDQTHPHHDMPPRDRNTPRPP